METEGFQGQVEGAERVDDVVGARSWSSEDPSGHGRVGDGVYEESKHRPYPDTNERRNLPSVFRHSQAFLGSVMYIRARGIRSICMDRTRLVYFVRCV